MSEMNEPSSRGVVLSGLDAESLLLVRIAELEAEVRALTAELARVKALAITGDIGSIGSLPAAPGGLGAQPTHVNADGTQGMRRGVSARPVRSPRRNDPVDG